MVREDFHVLDSASFMHSAGSLPLPLPDGHLDVLGSLVHMFLPSLFSATILKLTVAPLVSSFLFPQPMQ